MVDLTGLRVLVVEDEGIVALLLEDLLEDLGCELVSSVARVAEAREAFLTGRFNFAILDVNLGGDNSFDLARSLIARQIPFVFSTGYGNNSLPEDLGRQVLLTKPFAPEQLRLAIQQALQSRT